MNIHYTGKRERLYPGQQEKIESRFEKISRLLDNREGDKEAHVILTSERHLHNAEVTVNFLDHSLVGIGSDPDQSHALAQALDKLEKQVIKTVSKRRDIKKGPRNMWDKEIASGAPSLAEGSEPEPPSNGRPKVFRVDPNSDRKPMTLEEALIEIEQDGDYLVYRVAGTDRLAVLLRRDDGNFDLIES